MITCIQIVKSPKNQTKQQKQKKKSTKLNKRILQEFMREDQEKANVEQLILTHLSPRYTPGNETSPNDLLNEAKAIFPNTQLAKDFLQIDVNKSRNCNSS